MHTKSILPFAVAAALSLWSVHAAAVSGSLAASFDDLTFQVIDLNPNDGIAPTFSPTGQDSVTSTLVANGVYSGGGGWQIGAGPMAPLTQSQQASYGSNSESISGNAWGAGASVKVNVSTNVTSPTSLFTINDGFARLTGPFDVGFTLSPHTRVVISAFASLSTSLDSTTQTDYADSTAQFQLGSGSLSDTAEIDSTVYGAGHPVSDTRSGWLTVSLDNTTNKTIGGVFLGECGGQVVATAVPEPASGVLLAAGLVLLGVAARRRTIG